MTLEERYPGLADVISEYRLIVQDEKGDAYSEQEFEALVDAKVGKLTGKLQKRGVKPDLLAQKLGAAKEPSVIDRVLTSPAGELAASGVRKGVGLWKDTAKNALNPASLLTAASPLSVFNQLTPISKPLEDKVFENVVDPAIDKLAPYPVRDPNNPLDIGVAQRKNLGTFARGMGAFQDMPDTLEQKFISLLGMGLGPGPSELVGGGKVAGALGKGLSALPTPRLPSNVDVPMSPISKVAPIPEPVPSIIPTFNGKGYGTLTTLPTQTAPKAAGGLENVGITYDKPGKPVDPGQLVGQMPSQVAPKAAGSWGDIQVEYVRKLKEAKTPDDLNNLVDEVAGTVSKASQEEKMAALGALKARLDELKAQVTPKDLTAKTGASDLGKIAEAEQQAADLNKPAIETVPGELDLIRTKPDEQLTEFEALQRLGPKVSDETAAEADKLAAEFNSSLGLKTETAPGRMPGSITQDLDPGKADSYVRIHYQNWLKKNKLSDNPGNLKTFMDLERVRTTKGTDRRAPYMKGQAKLRGKNRKQTGSAILPDKDDLKQAGRAVIEKAKSLVPTGKKFTRSLRPTDINYLKAVENNQTSLRRAYGHLTDPDNGSTRIAGNIVGRFDERSGKYLVERMENSNLAEPELMPPPEELGMRTREIGPSDYEGDRVLLGSFDSADELIGAINSGEIRRRLASLSHSNLESNVAQNDFSDRLLTRLFKGEEGALELNKAKDSLKSLLGVIKKSEPSKRRDAILSSMRGNMDLARVDAQDEFRLIKGEDASVRKNIVIETMKQKHQMIKAEARQKLAAAFPNMKEKDLLTLTEQFDEVIPNGDRIRELLDLGLTDEANVARVNRSLGVGLSAWKKVNTVWNVGLMLPNAIDNVIKGTFGGANWNYALKHKKDLYRLITDFKHPESRDYLAHGIIGQEAFSDEFRQAEVAIEREIEKANNPHALMLALYKAQDLWSHTGGRVERKLGKAINIPDQFLKVLLAKQGMDKTQGIRNGLNPLKKDYFNDLSEAQTYVSMFTNTYSNILPGVKKTLGGPITEMANAQFWRYPFETARIGKNILVERPAYAIPAAAALYMSSQLMWYMGAAGFSMFGYSAPTSTEIDKAYKRVMQDPNNKGKVLVPKFIKNPKGEVEFWDMTGVIPLATWYKNIKRQGIGQGTVNTYLPFMSNEPQIESVAARTAKGAPTLSLENLDAKATKYVTPYRKFRQAEQMVKTGAIQRKPGEREGVDRDIQQLLGFPTVEGTWKPTAAGAQAKIRTVQQIQKDLTDVMDKTKTPGLSDWQRTLRKERLQKELAKAAKGE